MKPPESAQEEAQNLVTAFPDEETFLLGLLERQLNILHQRSQVVIGVAAVAISTTGTSLPAQALIIVALAIILVACLWIFMRVLSVKWVLTRCIQPDITQTLTAIILYRNAKTNAYRLGSIGVFLGLAIYACAFAIMLLNPTPLTVPLR